MSDYDEAVVDAVRSIVDRHQRPRFYAGDWARDQALRILRAIDEVAPEYRSSPGAGAPDPHPASMAPGDQITTGERAELPALPTPGGGGGEDRLEPLAPLWPEV